MKGKKRCRILKDIRRRIAEENGIEFITTECKYKGDCLGTCPKCEAEVRYLERELEHRKSLGYKVTVAGLVVGLAMTPVGCVPEDFGELQGAVAAFVDDSADSDLKNESGKSESSLFCETSTSELSCSEDSELMGEEPAESDESNSMVSDEKIEYSEETELILMGDMIPEEEEVEPDVMPESSFEEETELMGEPVDYE